MNTVRKNHCSPYLYTSIATPTIPIIVKDILPGQSILINRLCTSHIAVLWRLEGQQIHRQICLRFSDLICFTRNIFLLKETCIYFYHLNLGSFVYFYIDFIYISSSKEDQYSLKWSRPSSPLNWSQRNFAILPNYSKPGKK